jgi:hypothetical protein
LKIHGDILKSRFASVGVVDTGGKFATDVKDTKLPPVSTIPAANLQPVLKTPEENLRPVSKAPVANNGNIIRLLTPYSELEGKNLSTYMLTQLAKSVPTK